MRKEVNDSWQDSFRDVLLEYLKRESRIDEVDETLLHKCYVDSLCTIYSRMQALEVISGATISKNNSRCTCPLVDLISGDREGSPRCNTQLLEYPGTHVALQATRNIATGEELMFSCGQVSNQDFVTKFGFLTLNKPGNPQIDSLPPTTWEESDSR